MGVLLGRWFLTAAVVGYCAPVLSAEQPDYSCGGALRNPVRAGGGPGAGSDDWTPNAIATEASLSWVPLSHNGSAGSLQVANGTGTWTTNMTGLAGKMIRLSFFRLTDSAATEATVKGEVRGASGGASDKAPVVVSRHVSAIPLGWQEQHLGDFSVPSNSSLVTLQVWLSTLPLGYAILT